MNICYKRIIFLIFYAFVSDTQMQADPFSQIHDERYINPSWVAKDARPHTDKYLVVPRFKKFQKEVREWPFKDRVALGYSIYVPVMTAIIWIFC